MSRQRGFTLVELMVALTVGLAIGGLLHRQLLLGRRVARAQAERLAMQENLRAAALVLSGELGVLGYDDILPAAAAVLGLPVGRRSDLLALAPGAVTYLASRGEGSVCGIVPGSPGEVRVPAGSWRGLRSPRNTDSLLAFVESDPATAADDAWVHLGIAAVSAAVCPDGREAIALTVVFPDPPGLAALSGITAGSPVRLVEVVQMRYYGSGGKSWFGMRSVSTGEAITPVAGPLADSTAGTRGLTLRYLDAAGTPTADPGAVRTVGIALLGVTDQAAYGRDVRRPLVDSLALSLQAALRNGLRP
jgi:prepilin-type N-terminal cleavage/methylation domain-containing protein